MTRGMLACVLCVLVWGVLSRAQDRAPQEPSQPQAVSAAELRAAIDSLGKLDHDTRTTASRTVRRTTAAQAVPALIQTVSDHPDGYVRYRALVLLTGFNDPRTRDVMREALSSPNDRLRTVAYSFFEHNPDRALVPGLLAAVDKELGEFVRPSLVRALAAQAAGPSGDGRDAGDGDRVRQVLLREAGRGQDFFRTAVIEALGDFKAQYAFETLTAIAKLDGPLQNDTAIALGKIGDKRAMSVLADLQRTAPKETQPYVAAAICLLDVNCETHQNFLVETLKFADANPGYQAYLRAAAAGLADVAIAGHAEAADSLFTVGIPSRDPTRAPVSLALAAIALRRTPLMMTILEKHPKRDEAIELMAEGFDILEEDYEKERFFAFVRHTYWDSPDGSPVRALMRALIGKLEF
jgi:HEAT repeat protein